MRRNKAGFTLIELMLAMSFISVLLVSIAVLTIQISHLYTRGLTMKEINQVGAQVASDLQVTIGAAYADGINIKEENGGSSGRKILCTGKYSFVMNDPTKIEAADNGQRVTDLIKYSDNSTVVRFAKVRDESGALCAAGAFETTLTSDAVELLGAGDRSLVVRHLTISPKPGTSEIDSSPFKADFDAGRMLYTLHLTFGTGTNNEINDDQCKPPADAATGDEYCAVNTFVIVARVGNTYKN